MTGYGIGAIVTGPTFAILNGDPIVDLLPDRKTATVVAWLAQHPSITVIAQDCGAGYK
jgi:hypothetical protein